MKRLALGLLICAACHCQAATLSSAEQKISQAVVEEKQRQIDTLRELVNINSGTSNINGVRRVGERLRMPLKRMGFKTRWVMEPPAMHHAGTLIAERTGKQGKRLLLIAHLDTVFANHSPFQRFSLHQHSATGPGVTDDKGGLAVLLAALSALHKNHALDNTNITIVMTGDEEDSGKPTSISRKPLIDAAKTSDVALDFEPAITLDTATIARRGISQWKLRSSGKEAHSAAIFQPDIGFGAIFELTRVLNTMRTTHQEEANLTFNPGIIVAGTSVDYNGKTSQGEAFGKQNVIAQTAMAAGDVRYLDEAQKAAFEKNMQSLVQASLPGTHSTITFENGIPAMPPTKNNAALLEQYSDVSQALGQGAVKPFDPALRGAADISHVAGYVTASLSGLGPVGANAHAEGEMVELDSLATQAQRAAIFIYRLTR